MARITGGRARGHVLEEAVAAGVRPTSERVREALFSILGQDLTGLTVLDAFGGTGLLGLEAWSRGATVTIAERDRRAARGIERRAARLGATVDVRVLDVITKGSTLGSFDGVLADPPWALEVAPLIASLAPLATQWLVLEADEKTVCPEQAGALALDRRRTYGRTALWVYRATT